MPKGVMPTAIKLRWIDAMVKAGIAHMEVGSFVHPKLVPQMADSEAIVRHTSALPGLEALALVPNLKGTQRAYAGGVSSLVIPVSVSDSHSRSNTNKGTFEQVAEVASIVSWVRAQARPVKVEAACATAFGCSMEGSIPEARVIEVAVALVKAGVDKVSLTDTVGYAHPNQIPFARTQHARRSRRCIRKASSA